MEGENSSLPGEGEIKELQACLFEDGAMTEIYTQFTQKDGQYMFQTDKQTGHLYILANIADQINVQELKAQGITEDEWQQITFAHAEDYIHAPEFFSGMIDLGQTAENALHLHLERGIARFDLSIRTTSSIKVKKVVLKNMTHHTFLFPQNPVTIPTDAGVKDRSIEFPQWLETNTQGIAYVYEQSGEDLKASMEIVKNGKRDYFGIYPSIYFETKRSVHIRDYYGFCYGEAKLNIVEWKNGGDHTLSSGMGNLKVDTQTSILPENGDK